MKNTNKIFLVWVILSFISFLYTNINTHGYLIFLQLLVNLFYLSYAFIILTKENKGYLSIIKVLLKMVFFSIIFSAISMFLFDLSKINEFGLVILFSMFVFKVIIFIINLLISLILSSIFYFVYSRYIYKKDKMSKKVFRKRI